MTEPTIHPFRKSSTPIPCDILARICRIHSKDGSKSAIVDIAFSRRAYDVAIPILYHRLTLHTHSWERLFYGLAPKRPHEATLFEQYFSYSSRSLPTAPTASQTRKLLALSNIETLHIRGFPPLWICKLLEILDLSTNDDDDEGSTRLFPHCRYIALDPVTLKRPTVAYTRTSHLFCSLLPQLVLLSTCHICLKHESLWSSARTLKQHRFASLSLHDEGTLWADFYCNQRIFFPGRLARHPSARCQLMLSMYLRFLFEEVEKEIEEEATEGGEPDVDVERDSKDKVTSVELIGSGQWYSKKSSWVGGTMTGWGAGRGQGGITPGLCQRLPVQARVGSKSERRSAVHDEGYE